MDSSRLTIQTRKYSRPEPVNSTGCATMANYTPVQKTVVSAYSAKATYEALYETVRDYTPKDEKERAIYNETVAMMNAVKPTLAAYCDAVDLWRKTQTKPVTLDTLQATVDRMLADIVTAISAWGGVE